MEVAAQQTEILETFREAALEVDNKKLEDLKPSDNISALGIDSVALLEVVGHIEEKSDPAGRAMGRRIAQRDLGPIPQAWPDRLGDRVLDRQGFVSPNLLEWFRRGRGSVRSL